VELEKLFIVVAHELPSRAQLEEIARGIATEAGELPEGNELKTVLDASAGLTRYEAEGAYSLSDHDRRLLNHPNAATPAAAEMPRAQVLGSGTSTQSNEPFMPLNESPNVPPNSLVTVMDGVLPGRKPVVSMCVTEATYR
jgi:hypothetical protein